MKTLFLLLGLIYSNISFGLELEVISTDIAFQDENGRPSLCLLVGQDQQTKQVYGIVEDQWDCFYTRKALKQNTILVDLNDLQPLSASYLRDCLQSWDSQLVLFESTVE